MLGQLTEKLRESEVDRVPSGSVAPAAEVGRGAIRASMEADNRTTSAALTNNRNPLACLFGIVVINL
jgi:hypothetical protein